MAGKFIGGYFMELTWPFAAGNSLRILWNSPGHWPLADGREIRWPTPSGTHRRGYKPSLETVGPPVTHRVMENCEDT